MAAPTEQVWERTVREFFSIPTLHRHQVDAIQSILDGRDVFLSVCTGGGKSLCYHSYVVAGKAQFAQRQCGPTGKAHVIVISPLNTIMEEQVAFLNAVGISAACLGKDQEKTADILNGTYQYVYTSPETILGKQEFRDMLRNEFYSNNTGLLVVDEAHTVIQWGVASEGEDKPFREWFSHLGELRSLLPGTPVLALTATASNQKRKKIQKSLGMHKCKELVDNPNRQNIKLHIQNISSTAPLTENFRWLLDLVSKYRQDCPRLLIFCKSIGDCSKIYCLCKQYIKKDHLKHVDMYHSKTPETTKLRIREDMSSEQGQVRVLVCTNAAGMGVNYVGVNNVVNYGPPIEMDTLLQQQGRAGRTGQQAHHLLLYHNRQLRNVEAELLEYVRNEEGICQRKIMLAHYNAECQSDRVLHACCDKCELDCKCGSVDCKECKNIVQKIQEEQDQDSESGDEVGSCPEVKEEQKRSIKHLLQQYRRQLEESAKSSHVTAAPEITHGLTDQVIDTIVDQCALLKSPDDVLAKCRVWSFDQAKTVFDIIGSVLEVNCDLSPGSDPEYMLTDD